jgi:hypothetical protein
MAVVSEDEARAILGDETPYVRVTADGILILSGYSEALARLLRWVPKANWRTDRRAWLVPLAGAGALRSVLPEINRLAEAAVEERHEERTHMLGGEWLPALAKAAGQANDGVAALIGSAAAAERSAVEKLVAALRTEAARLSNAADRLEKWIKEK